MRLYENSVESISLRVYLGVLAGIMGFVIMQAIFSFSMKSVPQFATPLPSFLGWVSFAYGILVAWVLCSGVINMNPNERKRRLLGGAGIIILFGMMSLFNHDLFTGDMNLESLRCTSIPKGKYIQLEPCLTVEVPTFSSSK